MNIFYKAFCRIFQLCFKIALPLLPYREPKILSSMMQAAVELKRQGKKHVLIVTDPGIVKLGLLAGLHEALRLQEVNYTTFSKVVPNPTIACVEEARAVYLKQGCDCILAFGGGSSMDCAKAMGARIAKPNQPVQKMRGILRVHKRLPLLVAVPTTAGTGSEVTLAAVITDGETHHKYPINDFSLIPRVAVLDPKVTMGLPPFITATTGMDALVHAVEAYIGNSTTKETRAHAVEATSLIHQYLLRAYHDGATDVEAREKMLRAAYAAGAAFTKSYVGYVHGVAHSLGGQYGTPHGLANAVLMPYVLEAYGSAAWVKLARLAREAGVVEDTGDNERDAAAFIAWVREMNAEMGIGTKISGIVEADIPLMASHAAKESNPLYPVPKLFGAKELEQFYYAVME